MMTLEEILLGLCDGRFPVGSVLVCENGMRFEIADDLHVIVQYRGHEADMGKLLTNPAPGQ